MIVAGERWERMRDIPLMLPEVPPGTVRAWAARGRVRRVRLGGEAWVAWADVLDAEAVSARRRSGGRASAAGIDGLAARL